MSLTSWLQSLQTSLSGRDRRRSHKLPACGRSAARRSSGQRASWQLAATEELEPRALLTVSALLIGSELNVFSDGSDSILVQTNAGGQVEILANGAVLTTAPTPAASAVTGLVVTGGDGNNLIDLSGVTAAQFTSLTNLSVSGDDGNDTITGSPDLANTLLGGDGTDVLTGGSANDSIDGGNGADTISGGLGNDTLRGGNGADVLNGDAGLDLLDGGDGADLLNGGDDADNILGGNGADNIDGGLGNDTINSDGGNDTVTGNAGNDSILGGANNDSLLGGDGDDTINAQGGNDTVNGDAGDDSLSGESGFDSLLGSTGQDLLNGGADDDTLVGGADLDTLFGGAGNDSLFGDEVSPQASSVGNDVLNGQAGNDTLEGGGGNDSLDGGTGNDLLQPNVVDLSASGLSLSIDDATVTEGDAGITNVSVTVRLSRVSVEPVRVDYTNTDDTALSGTDYQAVSGTLLFAAGQISRTIIVAVRGDILDEADEQFRIELTNSSGATLGNSQGTVTIIDNDLSGGLPQLTIDDVIVNPELDGAASFTFAPADNYTAGPATLSVTTNDFDNDGDIDIAAGNLNQGPVSLFLNDGQGGFSAGTNLTTPTIDDLYVIRSGDLDDDGDIDLVLGTQQNFTGGLFGAGVAIALNNGNAVFTISAQIPIPGSIETSDLILDDLDGDSDLDIAACHAFGGGAEGITILQNDGSASFVITATIAVAGGQRGITAGDFNGDGNVDLATDMQGASMIAVLLGNGTGSFGAPGAYNMTSDTDGDIATSDLDGDGDLDLVVANLTTMSVFLNINNSGVFATVMTVPAAGSGIQSLVAVDVDGDFDTDLLTTTGNSSGRVGVLRNNGNATFQSSVNFVVGSSPSGIAVADFNGDSLVDAVTANRESLSSGSISVLINARDPAVFASGVVRLSSPSPIPVTATLSTSNGLALSGSDYQSTSIMVTIPTGVTSVPFTIPILSDAIDEPNEGFFVNLSAAMNATIGDSQGQVTIVDDDGGVIAPPTLTVSDVTLAEGNAGTTNFVFNVTLTRPAGNNSVVTVQYQTADDSAVAGGPQSDYTAAGPTTLTFAAGVTTQQITIPVNGDVFVEPDEAFFVNLLNPVGALLTDSRAVGLIQDDDGGPPTPLVLVNDVLIDEASSSAVVTLTLSSAALSPVTVNFSTLDGTARAGQDFSATIGTISIPIGATSGTTSIPISGDTRDELAEFFTVSLLSASNAILTATSLQVTIQDDDGVVFSSPNDAVLIGGDGNDTVNGGLGNDTLNGGAGNDFLSGGTGNDSVLGGSGGDTLRGGEGNDTLNGQGGNDSVEGDAGDDVFVWTLDGIDSLSGGVGFDSVSVNGTAASDSLTIGQTLVGEEVIPRLTVTGGGATLVVSNVVSLTINGNGGDDSITLGSVHQVDGVVLTINGGAGNDSLSATGAMLRAVRLRLNGDAGNDTLTGSVDRDTLDGGDGDDLLSGGSGNDSQIGGLGNDVLNGNDGNDSLNGGDGDDTLRGNAGNDAITGGEGNDSALGGEGADTVAGDAGEDTINGEAGNDSLSGGLGADTISGGDGADTLDGGTLGDSLSGGGGDDLIRGGEGDDTLDAGDGNDSLIGNDGADQLLGGNGNDAINAGDGNDLVNGGAGNDSLLGGDGNDTIRGGAGNDVLLGGDGDDNLDGQGGTDTLAGNEGIDTISNVGDVINEAFTLSATLLTALET